jgi:hypothetical protein
MVGSALAFGMLGALVKGDHGGVRDTIGNLSTPWLLVAFVPGLFARTLPRGAALGLAATMTALLGFYLVVTVTLDDQLPDLRSHLEHVLHANRRWLYSGLLSGPVMGAFGAWMRRFPAWAAVLVTGLLFLLEPVVIVAARFVPGWRHVIHWTLTPGPYVASAVLGVVLILIAGRRLRRT